MGCNICQVTLAIQTKAVKLAFLGSQLKLLLCEPVTWVAFSLTKITPRINVPVLRECTNVSHFAHFLSGPSERDVVRPCSVM